MDDLGAAEDIVEAESPLGKGDREESKSEGECARQVVNGADESVEKAHRATVEADDPDADSRLADGTAEESGQDAEIEKGDHEEWRRVKETADRER